MILITLIPKSTVSYNKNPNTCLQCQNALSFEKRNYKFCNCSCSVSYNNTKRQQSIKTKQKISKTLKNTNNNKPKLSRIKLCKNCNKYFQIYSDTATNKFCSKECRFDFNRERFSEIGRNNILKQKQQRRSKNERLFAIFCKKHFNKILLNEPLFNGWDADVIIEDIKVAILWNGKWHYEKITKKHSVKQVQNRDKIKIKEIKKHGYVPYIIKDMGKYNPSFVKEQFNIFLRSYSLIGRA